MMVFIEIKSHMLNVSSKYMCTTNSDTKQTKENNIQIKPFKWIPFD